MNSQVKRYRAKKPDQINPQLLISRVVLPTPSHGFCHVFPLKCHCHPRSDQPSFLRTILLGGMTSTVSSKAPKTTEDLLTRKTNYSYHFWTLVLIK